MILTAIAVVLGIVNLFFIVRLNVKLSDLDWSNKAWHTLHNDILKQIRSRVYDRDK